MSNLIRNTITSMEVAKMVGKEHSKLLRDIRNYVVQLGEAKIGFTDFFKEATYTTEQNKILPCFQVTKKGCEFIAHKLTGQKGTEFTARYINRFHEMEDGKLPCPLNPIIASSVAELTARWWDVAQDFHQKQEKIICCCWISFGIQSGMNCATPQV